MSEDTPQDQWWYCLKHERVEQGPGCPNRMRMGPYPDHDTAASAMSIAARRNEEWDAADGEE